MPQSLEIRILLPTDKETVLAFGKSRLAASIEEPMEREMQSWNARWRPEALDHYLPQGWSFGVFSASGEMRGYILGQPFLFYRGHTQTLWIEQMDFVEKAVGQLLLEAAHGWARDKHLQCVLVEENEAVSSIVQNWKQAHPVNSRWIEIKSSKYL